MTKLLVVLADQVKGIANAIKETDEGEKKETKTEDPDHSPPIPASPRPVSHILSKQQQLGKKKKKETPRFLSHVGSSNV